MNKGLRNGLGLISPLPEAISRSSANQGRELRTDPTSPGGVSLSSGPQLPVGYYVMTTVAANASQALTGKLNTELCWPLLLPGAGVLDTVGIQLMANGDTGSVIRIGVRADNKGLPSATVLAEGTLVADAGATIYRNLGGLSLPYGNGLFWFSICWQGGTTTAPGYQRGDGAANISPALTWGGAPLTTEAWAVGHGPFCSTKTGVTGTFAAAGAPAGATSNQISPPLIVVRRAA